MVTNRSVLGAALAETIQADLAQPLRRPPRADRPLPGVAPMMALAGRDEELSKLEQQRDSLIESLKQHEGARPARLLDPNDIVPSRFSNRHSDSYRDEEYLQLRDEIRAAGGNTQPIGVRPLPGAIGKYELSFGSRRRMACLENGLPVLAMIEEMDEIGLFERMERENRARKNLRPYEQGVLYRQALDADLYPSAKRMAADLQIDLTGLGRLLAIARLPQAVIEAFTTPLDIQAKWGPLLATALQRNEQAVLEAASRVRQASPKPAPQKILEAMLTAADGPGERAAKVPPVQVRGAAGELATISFKKNTASVSIANIPPDRQAALEKIIRKFLE